MIETLHIENFRSFKDYTLSDLRRVNLLVGPNGCGKTSVLEAVHFLLECPSALAIVRAEALRGTVTARDDFMVQVDVANLFGDRVLAVDSRMCVRSAHVEASAWLAGTTHASSPAPGKALIGPERYLNLLRKDSGVESSEFYVESGSGRVNVGQWGGRVPPIGPKSLFVDASRTDWASTAALWDEVVVAGREDWVGHSMSIVLPQVRDVGVLLRPDATSDHEARNVRTLVGLNGTDGRVPIGVLGGGAVAVFALAGALVAARNRTALIDEIDTGLHYSIMADLWKLVIETARKLDVQVFATTHSLDWIHGLRELLEREPELLADVSIQKIERGLNHSVQSTDHSLEVVLKHGIEVRG